MATSDTTGSNAAQNLTLAAIQEYLRQQGDKDRASAASEATNGVPKPERPTLTGMDFGPYSGLLSAIKDQSYSRDNAIADSQGFIANIFRDYENKSLPALRQNSRASGIYDDSSTQLLEDNAYGAAVAEGQANLIQNIKAYAAARQDQLGPVLALMQGQVSNNNALIGGNASLYGSDASMYGDQYRGLLESLKGSAAAAGASRGQQVQNWAAVLQQIPGLWNMIKDKFPTTAPAPAPVTNTPPPNTGITGPQ